MIENCGKLCKSLASYKVVVTQHLGDRMSFKISFQGMEHSAGIENHAKERVAKVDELLVRFGSPHTCEFHLHSHPNHAHQECVFRLKAGSLDLTTRVEDADCYVAIDLAVEKMLVLLKKEKEKIRDSHHKVMNEKRSFEKN